jgi:hypothetical protein
MREHSRPCRFHIIINNNNNNTFIDLKSKHWTIIKRQNRTKLNTCNTWNARASENYLAMSSKSVEIFWAEIYWGRLFFRAESSLIQSSCRSFIRVIVPYERGYKTSGSPLRFMLRRSSLVECVSVLLGNRCLQNVEFFFFDNMISHVC